VDAYIYLCISDGCRPKDQPPAIATEEGAEGHKEEGGYAKVVGGVAGGEAVSAATGDEEVDGLFAGREVARPGAFDIFFQ